MAGSIRDTVTAAPVESGLDSVPVSPSKGCPAGETFPWPLYRNPSMWSNDRFSSISITTLLTEPRPLPLVMSPLPAPEWLCRRLPAVAEPMVSPGAGAAGENAGRRAFPLWILGVRVSRPRLCLACAMTTPSLRDRLRGGEAVYGGWLTIPDVLSGRLLAAAGLDYVVVDLQHGGATERDLPAITTAIKQAGATPLARVRYAHPADIGRPLDLGCEGVIVPNVDSAEQATTVAGACRYPPVGYRSAGGTMAFADPLCLVMVESLAAIADLPLTLALDGVDGIYVGPRDLSLALGCALDPNDPGAPEGAGADLGGLRRGGQAGRGPRLGRGDGPAVPGERLSAAHARRRRAGRGPHRRQRAGGGPRLTAAARRAADVSGGARGRPRSAGGGGRGRR